MKILVIGAGITGLSIGKLLNNEHEVKILEKDSLIGGIAKTKKVHGVTYHTVGGHCFNSKYSDIMSFVFDKLSENKWHKVSRISKINLENYEVNYPIEFSIKEIYKYDKQLAFEITKDLLSVEDNGDYKNLEDWFRKKFGNTLSDLYFLPYNSKIWNNDPQKMSYGWVQDKLPIPDKFSVFEGLMENVKDSMPHSYFYYPNSNDQNSLISKLADGLDIDCNVETIKIEKIDDFWVVNDKYKADMIISTMPLNILPGLIEKTPTEIIDSAHKLKYNKVTTMLWESLPTNKTWTYQPSKKTIFHRYIHIGSFFNPVTNHTITESIGEKTYEEMLEEGKKDPFLIKPLDFNVSDHAYVVYDDNREFAVNKIQEYLKSIGIHSIGRFGQWDYFNMDVCMKQSLELYKKITDK